MTPSVEFRGLSKAFHGNMANTDLSFKVRKGSVHAIIGENGAGKSTAMKILYGIYQPDEGEIYIEGKLWGGRQKPWSSSSDAILHGIGMVHQHFMLGGPHTVLDNILLGAEQAHWGWRWLPKALRPIDRDEARQRLESLSEQYGLKVAWDALVENLSVGVHQRIEILKLLYRDAKILILDEPTAVLTQQETNELFDHLRKLCHRGKTILMITHKLKEVMSIADRVTVFRAGKIVGEREIHKTYVEDLASLMVGRKVSLKAESPPQVVLQEPVLQVQGLSVKDFKLQEVSLQVRRGEVVGIAGVEGNGQAELLQVLLHPLEYQNRMKGVIEVVGKNIEGLNTRQIRDLGMGVIPDDRLRDALLTDRPAQENYILGLHREKPFCQAGLILDRQVEELTDQAMEEYDIRPRSRLLKADRFSGGNQQKLVIAREFFRSPKLLVIAQPTRGVDVGAIEFIHKKIFRARSEGSGILLISSELDEILALSDRILVMYTGKIIFEFNRGEVTEQALGLAMGGEARS